jgi:hypothetical protein
MPGYVHTLGRAIGSTYARQQHSLVRPSVWQVDAGTPDCACEGTGEIRNLCRRTPWGGVGYLE